MNPSGQIQHRMVKFSIEWGGWILGEEPNPAKQVSEMPLAPAIYHDMMPL